MMAVVCSIASRRPAFAFRSCEVDFQRAEFVPLNEEFDIHPLPQLSHIPQVMTSGCHLAVEITAIDVQVGRDETPRLFLFEVGKKIKSLANQNLWQTPLSSFCGDAAACKWTISR
ncbi:hypothetical protein M3Y99_01291000 [Aphelenchoides fujianensis]|nr:hypothetical protein M3Y99_01291000 [Aphelenchoides fujianensis]